MLQTTGRRDAAGLLDEVKGVLPELELSKSDVPDKVT
jgi:hypothetical protein